MPYTGNPSTDTNDAIRLLIGDLSTSTGSEVFADNEIDYFSAEYANPALAASAAVKSLIGSTRANVLGGIMSIQVGDLKLDYRTVSITDLMEAKAKQLRMLGVRRVKPYAGGISQSDKTATQSDTDWDAPFSRVGIHDNPDGGSTEYNNSY